MFSIERDRREKAISVVEGGSKDEVVELLDAIYMAQKERMVIEEYVKKHPAGKDET